MVPTAVTVSVGEGITNLSASMIGGIQPDVIRKLASDSYDDGFLQRTFLIMLRPAVMGKDVPTPNIVEKYRALVHQLIRSANTGQCATAPTKSKTCFIITAT